jgi:hypothetical protein
MFRGFLREKRVLVAVLTLVAVSFPHGGPARAANPNLKYFGYFLVDAFVDDPFDGITKSNYADEISSFSNTAHLYPAGPTDNIVARLNLMQTYGEKALLDVKDIFLTCAPGNTPSGVHCGLRTDYASRWNTFIATNNLGAQVSKIQAVYIADEPVWNGTTASELATIANTVDASDSTVKIAYVESYAVLDSPTLRALVSVPVKVDWVGFDRYAVVNPATNASYLNELSIIKSKRTTSSQRIVLVLDARWWQSVYTPTIPDPATMAQVATNYYTLANSDTSIVAMIGYHVPGGFDGPDDYGLRDLPQSVINEHIRIGKLVTGKP